MPNGADYGWSWDTWASPPLTISGEPEGIASGVRLRVHIKDQVWNHFRSLRLLLPSGEQMRVMQPPFADVSDPNELGRQDSPFTFDDWEPHYRDRFQSIYDPATSSYHDVLLPIDGSRRFRGDEELWSIGLHSLVNGVYHLVITDDGSEDLTGLPVQVLYWSLQFFGTDVGVPGSGSAGETRSGRLEVEV